MYMDKTKTWSRLKHLDLSRLLPRRKIKIDNMYQAPKLYYHQINIEGGDIKNTHVDKYENNKNGFYYS